MRGEKFFCPAVFVYQVLLLVNYPLFSHHYHLFQTNTFPYNICTQNMLLLKYMEDLKVLQKNRKQRKCGMEIILRMITFFYCKYRILVFELFLCTWTNISSLFLSLPIFPKCFALFVVICNKICWTVIALMGKYPWNKFYS